MNDPFDVWRRLCLAGFGLIFLFGCATPKPITMAPATGGRFTLDTPIEIIAADPAGAAVLDKDMPGLLTNSNYLLFKGMSLKSLAPLSSGRMTQQSLAQTQADLAALPIKRPQD